MANVFPVDFESTLKGQLKDAWPDFVKAHDQTPPVSVRVNPKKGGVVDMTSKIPWTHFGQYLVERPVFTLDPTFHAGAYYVQEASSMFLEQAFRQTIPQEIPLRVLDLCAAPGGKSTHLLTLLNEQSLLVSNEVIRSRVNILSENIQKWGSNNVIVTNNDAADFQRLPSAFDVIVLDAPCSGEGLFRKDPNAISEWSTNNVELCSARQKRIISDVWPALRGGGILIYSTCTFNEQEDEDNLLWLKQQHNAQSIPLRLDTSWGIHTVEKDGITGYKFYPHKVQGEGFFLSVIQKLDATEATTSKHKPSLFASPSSKTDERIRSWIKNPDEVFFIQRDETIQFFPIEHKLFLEQVARALRIQFAGTFLGGLKHDKIIPEHALALSTKINADEFFKVELSKEEALNYLRRESLRIDVNHKGFALAVYNGLLLGWMNVIPGRINNLYPQEWRIRMSAKPND